MPGRTRPRCNFQQSVADRAGRIPYGALLAMTHDEGLSVREAVEWCGSASRWGSDPAVPLLIHSGSPRKSADCATTASGRRA
jgi:hypothetical protein